MPASWSPKDDTLLFTVIPAKDANARGAVWTYARASGTAAPFGGIQAAQQAPTFSPDGRWVAYALGDGTYVQPFPATGARYQLPRVDADLAGTHPFWSSDGKMIFLSVASGPFAAANVTTQPTIAFGNPTRVPRPFVARTGTRPRHTDIAPDGRLIGLISPLQASAAAGTGAGGAEIRIVTNWFEELKRLVPVN